MINNNDENILDKVERSDLHRHIEESKLKKEFKNLNQIKLLEPILLGPTTKTDEWYEENIRKHIEGSGEMEEIYKSLFNRANSQNIKDFNPAFCFDNIKYSDNDLREYLKYINAIKEQCAPNINLYPELQLRREIEQKEIEKLFIEALKLDAINNELSASLSYNLMKYLANNSRNTWGISPTSNLILPRLESFKDQPSKIIVDNDILYLLDKDDLLILKQILSNGNLNLYNNILNAGELNDIRTNDLVRRLTKKR